MSVLSKAWNAVRQLWSSAVIRLVGQTPIWAGLCVYVSLLMLYNAAYDLGILRPTLVFSSKTMRLTRMPSGTPASGIALSAIGLPLLVLSAQALWHWKRGTGRTP